MPTTYDVFAKLIEKAPCKESMLNFSYPVSKQLAHLKANNWIMESKGVYTIVKNKTTTAAFDIIKYCLKNNLDYNMFFSKNIPKIILALYENNPNTRPDTLKGNKDILQILTYLEIHQFILVAQKRPSKGSILKHQLFTYLQTYFSLQHTNPGFSPLISKQQVLKLEEYLINPFENSIFSFLAGSAQLEGATVSDGETRDMLLHDIYPNKPQKDIQMVKNMNEALHYIIDHLHEDITTQHIKQINKAVMFSIHRHAGQYKKTQNRIQGNPHFKTATVAQVPSLMEQFCATINNYTNKNSILENIGFLHNELQRIHPFADGNSRTTRLVVSWLLAKHRLPLLVLRMGSFDEYMSLTKMSTQRDDVRLSQFIWSVLWHEQIMRR